MRSTRLTVHVRRCDGAIIVAVSHDLVDLVLAVDVILCHILQVNALACLLVDSQVVLCWVKQVLNALVVNLDHANGDVEDYILGGIFNAGKDGSDHARDDSLHLDILNVADARASHCVGLARSCLPVGKDRAIETIQDGVNDRLGSDVVHLFLI